MLLGISKFSVFKITSWPLTIHKIKTTPDFSLLISIKKVLLQNGFGFIRRDFTYGYSHKAV